MTERLSGSLLCRTPAGVMTKPTPIQVMGCQIQITGAGGGADQAGRLTSSTEADWGGRSHGGPGHGVALPAAGRGWALAHRLSR